MSRYEIYLIIHLIGAFAVFLAIGAAIVRGIYEARDGEGDKPFKRVSGMTHGFGLLALLVSGFGLMAVLQSGFQIWMGLKLVIWLVLGLIIAPIVRMPKSGNLFWAIVLLLGASAVFLVKYKPFL